MKKKVEGLSKRSAAINVGASRNIGPVDVTDDGEPIYGMTNSSDKSLSILKKIGAKFGDSDKDEESM